MKKILILLLLSQVCFANWPPNTTTGENYIQALSGQKIHASPVNLGSSNVTGSLPTANLVAPNIYYHYPITAGVVENSIVMNETNINTAVAPLSFKLAVNNDQDFYPQLYGVAKNVSGSFADIWLGNGTVVPGFNFGVFIGVDYYIDPANPGGLTYNPPATGPNPIKVGRALDATHLILGVQGNFVQAKGAIYTSDGNYDATFLAGSNGQVLFYNSAQSLGLQAGAAVVASAPFTYTTATRTLTAATATNSVAGFLSSADHTTFAAAAPAASPAFTGTVTLPASNLINGASAATNAVLVYKNGHIKSTQTTAPTATVNAHAGTGATCSVSNATDSAGNITLATTATLTATGEQCAINFNLAYNVAPICVAIPSSANAGALAVLQAIYFTSTTAKLSVNFNVASAGINTYTWTYHCIETQ